MKVPKVSVPKAQAMDNTPSALKKSYAIQSSLLTQALTITDQLRDKSLSRNKSVSKTAKVQLSSPTNNDASNTVRAAGLLAYLDMLLEAYGKAPTKTLEAQIKKVEAQLAALAKSCAGSDPALAALINKGLADDSNYKTFDAWFFGTSGAGSGVLQNFFFPFFRNNLSLIEHLGLGNNPQLGFALGMFFTFLEVRGEGPLLDADFFGFPGMAQEMAKAIAAYFYETDKNADGSENWTEIHDDMKQLMDVMSSIIPAGDTNLANFFKDGTGGALFSIFAQFFPGKGNPATSGTWPWPGLDPKYVLGDFFNEWDQWARKYLSGSLPPG